MCTFPVLTDILRLHFEEFPRPHTFICTSFFTVEVANSNAYVRLTGNINAWRPHGSGTSLRGHARLKGTATTLFQPKGATQAQC